VGNSVLIRLLPLLNFDVAIVMSRLAFAHDIERYPVEVSHPGYEVYLGARDRFKFGVGRHSL
jgi:hypothetical protein